MNTINPFPHVSPTPGPMGNQTPTRLSDLFQNRHQASYKPSSGYRLLIAPAFGNLKPGRFEGILRFMFMWMIFSCAPFASPDHLQSRSPPIVAGPANRRRPPAMDEDWDLAAVLLWKRFPSFPHPRGNTLPQRCMSENSSFLLSFFL